MHRVKKMKDGHLYVVKNNRPLIAFLVYLLLTIAVVIYLFFGLIGCTQPQQTAPNPSLVLHVTGTLNDPQVSWEYSRNDPYMGIRTAKELRSERERYHRHLSLTVRSTDRQETVQGRVRDSYRTETRTTQTIESKR